MKFCGHVHIYIGLHAKYTSWQVVDEAETQYMEKYGHDVETSPSDMSDSTVTAPRATAFLQVRTIFTEIFFHKLASHVSFVFVDNCSSVKISFEPSHCLSI